MDWKSIQSGTIETYDKHIIQSVCSTRASILPEWLALKAPISPHAAAKLEGMTPQLETLNLPNTTQHLVIEGAGGLMVPITDNFSFLDLCKTWQIPLILVSKHYLGSINHTLLSLEVIKSHNLPLHGVIFVGDENRETEQIIASHCENKVLGRIPIAEKLNASFIAEQANKLHPFL